MDKTLNNKVCISDGNGKLGQIKNVSLPVGTTCRKDCDCYKICYAKRYCNRYKGSMEAYENNYRILQEAPDIFWLQVESAIAMSRFFRFHVAGDIPNYEYFEKMVEISKKYCCEVLTFTKKYDIVNSYISNMGFFPQNLHVIFSGWRGLKMENPYNLPECHLIYKDLYCEAKDGAKFCGGNCTECALKGGGCWTLKNGEQIVIKQH